MAALSSSSRDGGGDAEGDAGLARALKNLELREGELDDVFIGEKELEVIKKQSRWLAVARVHTSKPFSTDALFQTLKFVWGLSREPELREVDDNLFTFKFFCLGDWNKVMNQGPWLFRKLVVVIAEYDGIMKPSEVAVWAQIHAIPELYRIQEVVDQLARRIGKVKSVEMNHQRWFEGDYVRVRASIDVNKPLIRFVPLNVGVRKMLQVKYEKIGFFCDVCGVMGHDLEECGDGIHAEEQIQYGKWMIAKRRTQLGGQGFFRAPQNTARFGGRGRGRGELGRKRGSGDAFIGDEDLEDTASSPIKVNNPKDREEDLEANKGNGTAGKKLDFGEDDKGLERSNVVEDMMEGVEKGPGSGEKVPPPPPGYIPPREKKRSKMTGENRSSDSGNNSVVATEAASSEDRQAQ
ncbi:hypothetical protein ACQ4PT_051867 [Festuca glaucescens]